MISELVVSSCFAHPLRRQRGQKSDMATRPDDDDPILPFSAQDQCPDWSQRHELGLRPVPAGCYGLRVCPGPDWDEGGFADQNEDSWGTTVTPNAADILEWVTQVWAEPRAPPGPGVCPFDRCHGIGGWWPTRSTVVIWDADPNKRWYYRAGDEGGYDLAFVPSDQEFDVAAFMQVDYNCQVRLRSLHPSAMSHVPFCEAAQTCTILRLMLQGFPLVEAVGVI